MTTDHRPEAQAPAGASRGPSRVKQLRAWFDIMVRDGGLIRLVLPNRHPVAEGVWRAGQPGPAQLHAFAHAGGRTVISLRAGHNIRARILEEQTCEALRLAFHTLPIRGHRLPGPEELRSAAVLFRAAKRPVLLHCQSGADRAGFAAALWLLLVEDRPLAEARRHLSPRYGHNPLGRAGLLDAFLEAYAAETARAPLAFTEWIETSYNPDRIAAEWRATSIRTRLWRRVSWSQPERQPLS